ncbi:MAG: hypothetical protein OEM63_15400 [Gammaproteobacteria bacterium]|nr:hypothetical protein [Gammaproteobacteria bacterium]
MHSVISDETPLPKGVKQFLSGDDRTGSPGKVHQDVHRQRLQSRYDAIASDLVPVRPDGPAAYRQLLIVDLNFSWSRKSETNGAKRLPVQDVAPVFDGSGHYA